MCKGDALPTAPTPGLLRPGSSAMPPAQQARAGLAFCTVLGRIARPFAAADCVAPLQANLKTSGYREVTDDDSFVAGFASGE